MTEHPAPPLASAPDQYFILKAARELFQRGLVDIVREAGVAPPALLETFSEEVGTAHDELVSSTQQDGFEQTAGLTASRISLVGNDDLELEIRIGEIASHLKSNDHIDHWRVQLRYMTLLDRPRMSPETNPLGVEPICQGIWALCQACGGDIDKQMDRLARLEERLQARLPGLYVELNELLARQNVEPARIKVVQRPSATAGQAPDSDPRQAGARPDGENRGMTGHNGGQGQASGNSFVALQQAVRQHVADNAPQGIPADDGNTALNAATIVMLNHLMERLTQLERQRTDLPVAAPAKDETALGTSNALRAKDLDLPLGQPAAIALDTLSFIFEAIFASRDVPDAIKTIIGRLQIPLLRVAILDDSFFSSTRHPARQLINRMGRAVVGLPSDCAGDHPLCVRLTRLADAARVALESGSGKLDSTLAELDALITKRDSVLRARANPYAQLVSDHERLCMAQRAADDWLKRTEGLTDNMVIRQFFSDPWHRAMQTAWLDGGDQGARWKDYGATVTDLLWSLQPQSSVDDRKRLAGLIPSLLKRINSVLDALAVTKDARTPFLDTCFELQTAALRHRPGNPVSLAPRASAATPSLSPQSKAAAEASTPLAVNILEKDGKLVQYVGPLLASHTAGRHTESAIKEGQWIHLVLPDETALCGLHCGQPSQTGHALIFNPGWGFAVALSPTVLEGQVRSQQARIASNASLFDDAAEAALRGLPDRLPG